MVVKHAIYSDYGFVCVVYCFVHFLFRFDWARCRSNRLIEGSAAITNKGRYSCICSLNFHEQCILHNSR